VGQLREKRRHNAEVVRRLLTGRGRRPNVEKLQRAGDADRLVDLLAYEAGDLVGDLRDRGRTPTGPALWAFDAATTIEHGNRDPALAALIRAMVDEREPIRRWAGGLLGAEPSTVDAREQLVRAVGDESGRSRRTPPSRSRRSGTSTRPRPCSGWSGTRPG
jgi:hypothetical protein